MRIMQVYSSSPDWCASLCFLLLTGLITEARFLDNSTTTTEAGRHNQTCDSDADCGSNERCLMAKDDVEIWRCACVETYAWDEQRGECAFNGTAIAPPSTISQPCQTMVDCDANQMCGLHYDGSWRWLCSCESIYEWDEQQQRCRLIGCWENCDMSAGYMCYDNECRPYGEYVCMAC